MCATQSEQTALIGILNSHYDEIYAIEKQWGIRFKEGDMRPRIDYFHDAVRALTSGEADMYAKNSRLSVEYLAYDITQLRMIQGNPIGKIYKAKEPSSSTDIITAEDMLASRNRGPDKAVRRELAQLYKDYTVIFAALFSDIADGNFKARCEEVDAAVEDIALVENILAKLAEGRINAAQASQLCERIENDALRRRILNEIIHSEVRQAEAERIISELRSAEARLEEEKRTADKAHMTFLTSQLAVYEDAKETVKRLALQGLNIAGKFVENAMAKAQGHGRGQGF